MLGPYMGPHPRHARLTGVNLPVVLIADKLAESTVAALGDQVEVRWVDGPDRPKLLEAVADADALLVRSATTVDAEVIASVVSSMTGVPLTRLENAEATRLIQMEQELHKRVISQDEAIHAIARRNHARRREREAARQDQHPQQERNAA